MNQHSAENTTSKPSTQLSRRPERYRRSPTLVVYWRGSGAVCFDCAAARHVEVTADVIAFLSAVSDWITVTELVAVHPELGTEADTLALLEACRERGLVEKDSEPNHAGWIWNAWMPEAAFFHFATRNRPYGIAPADYDRTLREKAKTHPPPPPTKSIAGESITLPRSRVTGRLAAALDERRTWRRFGASPVPRHRLATLLQSTWGVQHWRRVEGQGPVVLKTSPSGGARHSVEAYLIARRVAGVESGVYHYNAATHALVHIAPPVADAALARSLGHQHYFLKAGAFIVMTAVFARAMWRYPFSRAYRTVLAEAGHLGQTFCLVATALDLAPFCTMAFRDSEIESLIGVDGINESAIYIVGIGTRPKGRVAHPGKVPSLKGPRSTVHGQRRR